MDLNSIYGPISKELSLVEEELKRQINIITSSQSSVHQEFISPILGHLLKVPGKLLRPALVLLSGKAVNNLGTEKIDQLIKLATAVEFVHSASLIHDDIIDGSNTRRHQVSLNKQYGNQVAVLVGDIFYAQFFSILISLDIKNKDYREKLLRFFCDTTKRLCFGEIYEHKIIKNDENPTFEEYMEVIENKTASLFSISCMGGGLLYGADEEAVEALEKYGLFLGLAFQIVDDHIDRDSIFDTELDMIGKAKEYAGRAKNEIAVIPDTPVKKRLLTIPDFVIERSKVKNNRS
jgi:geranylgeranyl pyrophosphate synthase